MRPARASFTDRLLADAGIEAGMRVLDVGCGGGDVSMLVAERVGSSGSVTGIDRDAGPLAMAEKRTAERGLANLTFVRIDLADSLSSLGSFDAVVGRRVLMYVADPASVLRRLADLLRPGGLVVFEESDGAMVPARVSAMPLHDKVSRWMWTTVEREGANLHMGFALPGVLSEAGLEVEHLRAEALIQGQDTELPMPFIVRAMLPRMVEHGVVTETEVDIETLERRLADERAAHEVYVSGMAFGVIARKPRASLAA